MSIDYQLIDESLRAKADRLSEILKGYGSLAVAFSGGVDSCLLLAMSKEVHGDNVVAITEVDASVPQRELREAEAFCKDRGIKHIICKTNPLEEEGYRHNSPDRCYYCKKGIFTEVIRIAAENGIEAVAEGSNMDDNNDYRPGHRAIDELGVKSPLREAKLNKSEIRLLAKAMNLPTWSKPAYACLASRFVYGEEITEEKLHMIDEAEQFLIELGFIEERVRLHGNVARIEVPSADITRLTSDEIRPIVYNKLREIGFMYVSVDMNGYRTGSMNATL